MKTPISIFVLEISSTTHNLAKESNERTNFPFFQFNICPRWHEFR